MNLYVAPLFSLHAQVVKRPFSASSTRASNPRSPLSTPLPRSTTSYSNGASRKPCTRVTAANKKMQVKKMALCHQSGGLPYAVYGDTFRNTLLRTHIAGVKVQSSVLLQKPSLFNLDHLKGNPPSQHFINS